MPLPGILGGSKPSRSIFFEIFGAKEKTMKNLKFRGKIGNFGEISEKVINFWENIGKSQKNREKSEKRNFGGDILSISTDS